MFASAAKAQQAARDGSASGASAQSAEAAQLAHVEKMVRQQVEAMPVRDLRAGLHQSGIDTRQMLEKREMVDAVGFGGWGAEEGRERGSERNMARNRGEEEVNETLTFHIHSSAAGRGDHVTVAGTDEGTDAAAAGAAAAVAAAAAIAAKVATDTSARRSRKTSSEAREGAVARALRPG